MSTGGSALSGTLEQKHQERGETLTHACAQDGHTHTHMGAAHSHTLFFDFLLEKGKDVKCQQLVMVPIAILKSPFFF